MSDLSPVSRGILAETGAQVSAIELDAAAIAPPPSPKLRPGGLARNTFNLVLGQVLTTGLTILLSAAIGRTLGPGDFGILYLVTAVSTFAFVFVDWGHGPYVIREVARHPHRAGELMGTVMVLRVATALVLIIPSLFIGWMLGYERRTLLFIAAMMTAWIPLYLGLTYGWAFRGAERMEFDALINVVLKFLSLVFGIAMLALGARLPGVILAMGLAGTVTLVVATALYRRLHFPRLRVTRAMARELAIGGTPMVSMSVAVAIQPYIDANLLSRLAPHGVIGWYGAAMTFCNTLVAPAAVISSAAFPRLSVVASDRTRFASILHEALRPLVFVAVLGALGTFLFANVGVSVVYSLEKFGPSASILRAFAPGMLLVFIDMMLSTAIVAAGRAAGVAVAKAITVVVISALEIVLIPFFQIHYGNGGLGVMCAFFAGELLMIAADLYLLRGLVSIAIAVDLGRALLAGAGTLIAIEGLHLGGSVSGIPLCILMFTLGSFAVGLIRWADVQALTTMFRRRTNRPADMTTSGSAHL